MFGDTALGLTIALGENVDYYCAGLDYKSLDSLAEQFESSKESNRLLAQSALERGNQEDRLNDLGERQRLLGSYLRKIELFYEDIRKKEATAPTEPYPKDTKLRVTFAHRRGEIDVEVGNEGIGGDSEAHPWPQPPAGCTAVKFDATLFGFIVDEDDEDTFWIHLYIPNWALEVITG